LSVIVVEPGCKVKAFKKEDGASMIRFEMAYGKAYAALSLGRSSKLVRERAQERPIFMRYLIAASADQIFPEGGGMLNRDSAGEVIGAVGVTGDTEDRDEELAVHGIHAAGLKTDADCIGLGRRVGLPPKTATDRLSYESEHYSYKDVPIELRPLQAPHPPFRYGSSNEIGSTWAGEQGLHFVTLGPMATAKTNINAYKAALNKRGGHCSPKRNFPAVRPSACSGTSSSPALTRRRTDSSRPFELAARQAWRHRAHVTAERAARRQFRGLRRGSHCHCRLAGDGPRRDRATGPRPRRQLSADLSISGHHVACRCVALALAARSRRIWRSCSAFVMSGTRVPPAQVATLVLGVPFRPQSDALV
jgi:uncharacterized protein GlcG (DUF336 family)